MQYPLRSLAAPPTLPEPTPASHGLPWSLDTTFKGRLSEVSCDGSGGQSTVAANLVLAVQRAREPVAWLQPPNGDFYPPDAAAHGIDLDALVVVQVGDAQTPQARVRAAEILLQAGGFGLVVLDATDGALPKGWGWQGRLMALARAHQAAVVVLTRKARQADSLGAWFSLRLTPRPVLRRASPLAPDFFDLSAEVDKNKGLQLGGGWRLSCRGPEGLL